MKNIFRFSIMITILALLLLLSISSYAKEIRIGIADSGFDLTKVQKSVKLCSETQMYNTSFSESLQDVKGHGTAVLRYVESKINPNINHCYVLVKMFHDNSKSSIDKQVDLDYTNIVKALEILKKNKVDIVNLSYGGFTQVSREKKLIKELLDSKIVIVTVAGNDITNLDNRCNYYPACYDKRIIVVGDKNDTASNYGKIVDLQYNGSGIVCPLDRECYPSWGTSYSAARITGIMINKFEKFTNLINKKVYLSKEKK